MSTGDELDDVNIMTTDLSKALDFIINKRTGYSKYLTIFYNSDSYTQMLLYLNPSHFMIEIANLCDQELTVEARKILEPYIDQYLKEEEQKELDKAEKQRQYSRNHLQIYGITYR